MLAKKLRGKILIFCGIKKGKCEWRDLIRLGSNASDWFLLLPKAVDRTRQVEKNTTPKF